MVEEIIEEILWTDSAKVTFGKIIDYLEKEWTEREISKFIKRTEEVLSTLKRYPEIGRPSMRRKNVRIWRLDKHTQLIYHYKPGSRKIQVLLFWGMKQDPIRFKY